ncbi:MAG: hypothetical protein ABR595_02610 [Psychroflexus sp.]
MKRIILTVAVLVFAFQFGTAQDEQITIGAHVGIPTGDASDVTTLNVGVDASYYFLKDISEGLDIGLSTGYTMFMGDEDAGFDEDISYIPLAASARLGFSENFFASADLGYALSTDSDVADGGFYYQPKFGYTFGALELAAFYKSISEDLVTVSSFGVGVGYRF